MHSLKIVDSKVTQDDFSRPILLTGASGGLGRAIFKTLNDRGYQILAPTSLELDLSDPASVSQWLKDYSDFEFQGVVLAAGINHVENLFDPHKNSFHKIQELNFLANQELLSVIVPKMVERKYGRVVSISSAYSTIARSGRAYYSISKASLDALIRSIAIEFGSHNVLANSVVPGFIDTPLTRKNNNQLQIDQILARVPLGRLGTPEEIARLTLFLLSHENTYITGQRISIDGGFSVN